MAAASELSEEQKVAVLLASMNETVAASVLQQLEPEVMSRVADAIRGLGIVPGEVRDKAISDCVQGIVEMSNSVQGNEKMVNSLLAQAIGEKRATVLLQDRQAVSHDAFVNLADIPDEQIAGVLEREQPSVAAIVLKYISPEKSGKILGLLSSDVRKRVVVLMCTASPPAPEVVTQIETFLESKLGGAKKAARSEDVDTLDVVTSILQNIDRSIEEELLTAIDESSDTLGSELRDRLFTFEDIVNLSDVAMRRLLQEIDMGLLAMALRGASIDLREKFFKNMSKRASEGLKEEMEYSQKVKLTEVKERQKEIVNIIRSLEADGQISVGEGGADEYV